LEKTNKYKPKSKQQNHSAVAEPLSRREAGKEDRRQRIIKAAHDLIREHGSSGLSMRLLAERAGVSLATPYNLFGSKNAIIWSVLGDVREYQERFTKARPADPIERIFAAIDLAIEFYIKDAKFYRAVWAATFDVTSDVRKDIFSRRWNGFWLPLFSDAIASGAINRNISAEVLLRQFVLILRSAMFEWVVGDLSSRELGPTVFCGVVLMLKGAATPDWQAPLEIRLRESLQHLERSGAQRADEVARAGAR
jgi:AcrR family transcriptional regulator